MTALSHAPTLAPQTQARPGSEEGISPAPKRSASALNATTHGLFARETVLPHLGEDPDDFQALQNEIAAALRPADVLERQCVEAVAAATWRLERFRRWQRALYADLPEDFTPDPKADARLARLDRAARHERALQRQIDAALRALGKTLPELRAARRADVTQQIAKTNSPAPHSSLPEPKVPPAPVPAPDKKCQNEPMPAPWVTKNCQNELPGTALILPPLAKGRVGEGSISFGPLVRITQTRLAQRKRPNRPPRR